MEKLDVEIEVLKCKIQEENLQEDFKEKLEEKLNNACNTKDYITMEDIKKKKILTRPYFCQKAAAAFACFIMFSSCAFAGGVGDWIKEMFSNVDQNLEVAYENGDVKEIETEYQTYDGVSVKVDYISLKDNELYMVFNVKTEEVFDHIYINDFIIKDNYDNVVFENLEKSELDDFECKIKEKKETKNNSLIFVTVSKRENNFDKYNTLKIEIDNVSVRNSEKVKNYFEKWEFNVEV